MYQIMMTWELITIVSQYHFGMAMDDDVRVLKEHYNHLLVVADTNRKVINLNFKRFSELSETFTSFYNTHRN